MVGDSPLAVRGEPGYNEVGLFGAVADGLSLGVGNGDVTSFIFTQTQRE